MKATKRLFLAGRWLFLIILVPGLLWAQSQTRGTLSGRIVDGSGSAIPATQVIVTNQASGQVVKTATNQDGFFTIPSLPSGDYDVTAEKKGFQQCRNTGVHLDPAGSAQINCRMKIGSVNQTVEVQAPSVYVQTDSATVSRVVNTTTMQQTPVNGRNFTSLLSLQPGVVTDFSFNSFQGLNIFATQSTHVNGLRGDANNIVIDGAASTRTRANGATVALPSMEAVGEVNIVSNAYMPEYSRAGGGQVIVQMKSGAQQYHGSAFEFLRNSALDARSFFASSKEPLQYNDFGFSFGGPVAPRSKKLFFYWTEEWFRQRQGSTVLGNVPTTGERAGDFSALCTSKPSSCPKVPTYLNGVDGLVAGQAFPNNQIPSTLFSPNGSAMVNMFSVPTNSALSQNFVGTFKNPTNQREDDVKFDYYPNWLKSHVAVTFRHFYQFNHSINHGSSLLLAQDLVLPSRGFTFDLSSTLSPTTLNDFTFAGTEDIVHVLVPSGAGLDRTSLGLNYPYIFGPQSKDVAGKIPTVNISGYDSITGLPYPSGSVGKVFSWQDMVSHIAGNHTFKTGIWVEQDGENDHDQVRVTPGGGIGNNLNGQFSFSASSTNPNTTGNALADTLLGNFDNYSELGFRNYTPWVARQLGWFAQDSWKVTPTFTLEGGIRWDYFPPYHSRWCNYATFNQSFYSRAPGVVQTVDPTTGLVTGGNPYNGIAVPCNQIPADAAGHFSVLGQPLTTSNLSSVNQQLIDMGMMRGLSPEIFQKHYNNWEPRLGFSWDPFGHGATAIRGGGGIFYNHSTLSDVSLMGGNTPFQSGAVVYNGSADNPGGTQGAQLPIPITGEDLAHKVPVIYQWNLTAEHMFAGNTLVDVGYVATRGRNLQLNSDLNQLPAGVQLANPGVNIAALRPYPGLGGIQVALNDASSQYDALQVSVQRRLSQGFQYGIAYTFSKAIDYGSSIYATAPNTYDLRYARGLSDFDRPNVLIVNYVYDLPFLKNSHDLAGHIAGGWEISGVASFESGSPVSISAGGDFAGTGDGGQRAQLVAGCNPTGVTQNIQHWFNTACFTAPATGTFGDSSRGILIGPGTANFDFGLFKNGAMTERFHYQFRAEFFNGLNHPSFNSVSTSISSGDFGKINGVGSPRQIQFGLKLLF